MSVRKIGGMTRRGCAGAAAGVLLLLALASGRARAGEDLKERGRIEVGYQGTFVRGDQGRFRQDRWLSDESIYGIDFFEYVAKTENTLLELMLRGRDPGDYEARVRLARTELGYVQADFKQFLRWYDGSPQARRPGAYRLPGGLEEPDNDPLYVRRMDVNLEVGLTLPDLPQVVVGWHRWEREGREVLRGGGHARLTMDPVPRFGGIATFRDVDGVSDTVYLDISHTFLEKYNLRLRQEWEQFRDHQTTVLPEYLDGMPEHLWEFDDHFSFTNWRTMLMFDSFLTDTLYVTGGYLYDYLRSESPREVRDHAAPNPAFLVGTHAHARRRSNTWSGGFTVWDLLPELQVSGGFRVEDSDQEAWSEAWSLGMFGRSADSHLDEVRVGETAKIVYRGIPRTTLSAEAILEQRDVKWGETADIRSGFVFSHNIVPGTIRRSVNIAHMDQTYALKAVHRLTNNLKLTGIYRHKDFRRDYHGDTGFVNPFYPGHLGDSRRVGDEASLAADWRFWRTWSLIGKYQYIRENIHTGLADADTQDLDIQRISGSLTGSPFSNLLLMGTFMVEDYDLETPAHVASNSPRAAHGHRPYSYSGDAWSLTGNADFALNSKVSTFLQYQHTEALGSVDRNRLDKVGVGLKVKIRENAWLRLLYEYMNFTDRSGDGFNNYNAHGVFVTYGCEF